MDNSKTHNDPNNPGTWGPPMHPAAEQEILSRPGQGNERWMLPAETPPQFQPRPAPSVPFGDPHGMPPSMVPQFLRDVAGGSFILNVIFVGVLWQVWFCLYPLSTLAAGFTFALATPLLRFLLPETTVIMPGLFPIAGGIIVALVVLWNASRLEEILARSDLYRVLRHLVRLPLLGMATAMLLQKTEPMPYDPSLTGIARVLSVPSNLAIVIAVIIASHFILWNWKWGREFWHRRLASAQLRRRGNQAVT